MAGIENSLYIDYFKNVLNALIGVKVLGEILFRGIF